MRILCDNWPNLIFMFQSSSVVTFHFFVFLLFFLLVSACSTSWESGLKLCGIFFEMKKARNGCPLILTLKIVLFAASAVAFWVPAPCNRIESYKIVMWCRKVYVFMARNIASVHNHQQFFSGMLSSLRVWAQLSLHYTTYNHVARWKQLKSWRSSASPVIAILCTVFLSVSGSLACTQFVKWIWDGHHCNNNREFWVEQSSFRRTLFSSCTRTSNTDEIFRWLHSDSMDASIWPGNVSEIDIGNQLITDQEAHNGPFLCMSFSHCGTIAMPINGTHTHTQPRLVWSSDNMKMVFVRSFVPDNTTQTMMRDELVSWSKCDAIADW